MKRSLLLLCAVVLAAVASGPLAAQTNPFAGTWKLNLAKSKFTGMPAPKDLTRTVTMSGATATYTWAGTGADGSAINYSFNSNYDGKDGAVSGTGMPGGADAIALTRVNSHHITAILKKGGTQVGTSDAVVSKDGKVSTVTGKGKGPDGKEFAVISVYDKQ